MSSGVKVNDQCTKEFEKLKMGKTYSYVIFKLNDKLTEVEVDQVGMKGEQGYEELKQILIDAAANKQCRYAVLDLDFEFKGAQKNKLLFIAWSPETATIKQKMTYTSSKDYLKKALQMVVEVQATDVDELSMENFVEKVSRGMKD